MVDFLEPHSTEPLSAKENSPVILVREAQHIDSWRITDDGVMGGKSAGRFTLHKDHAIFSGNISRENNGGFSSVYRTISPLEKALKTVSIKVKGDGLTYQLRLSVNIDGYRLAYKHNFTTMVDQQAQFSFLLTDFQATFRGRNIPNAPILLSENIIEMGFLVTRETAGPFSLAIEGVDFK